VDPIATTPDLVVATDYQDIMPYPGKRVTYTVHFSNEGHIATTGVVVAVTQPRETAFDPDASSDWMAQGGGRHVYEIGDLGFNEGGELLFVVTLTSTHFTTAMLTFEAVFEIYDDGSSGDDGDPAGNVDVAPLGVPNLVIEDVIADSSIWDGRPGFVTVTIRNDGTGPACGVYSFGDPCIGCQCTGFVLDPFLDPSTPPASYPIEGYGDCFAIVDPIPAGLAETVVISFITATLGITPGYHSGFCAVTVTREIWFKVDNWDPEASPFPAEFGLVPEYDEYDNVFGPITLPYNHYLPIVVRNH
jgi:uncharacterized repeat protein (TIGR01451 family)